MELASKVDGSIRTSLDSAATNFLRKKSSLVTGLTKRFVDSAYRLGLMGDVTKASLQEIEDRATVFIQVQTLTQIN
jgi:hypothetical protein